MTRAAERNILVCDMLACHSSQIHLLSAHTYTHRKIGGRMEGSTRVSLTLLIFLLLLLLVIFPLAFYDRSGARHTLKSYTADIFNNGTSHLASIKYQKPGMGPIEGGLSRARFNILRAIAIDNYTSNKGIDDFVPRGAIYRNPNAFHQLSRLC